VEHGGTYYGLDGVEPWGLPEKDARDYPGPHPVVAKVPLEDMGHPERRATPLAFRDLLLSIARNSA